mgnify:CR=1 FL=1
MSKSKLQKLKFHIAGFEGCPYFEGAVATLKNFKKVNHGKQQLCLLCCSDY